MPIYCRAAVFTCLGLTFGGGCSFGHGINASGGRAEFALTEYAIR